MIYIDQSEILRELTIVIPCKNEENYIGGLLYDLFTQTALAPTGHYKGVRIIIADAGSTDSTLERIRLAKENLKLDITVIQGGNVSEGRNAGAALATTKYILFLDADVRFFHKNAILDTYCQMKKDNLSLMTLKVKNYGKDFRASILFRMFNVINKIMTRKTPFAIGAFFLTRRDVFNFMGGFPNKYETSEDYILSKQYTSREFRIGKHYFGQDERRFKKLGYIGMLKYMIVNFFQRNNLEHFEKSKVDYWN
jgi:glycosyltransferase involved in cell wall biosynthesis